MKRRVKDVFGVSLKCWTYPQKYPGLYTIEGTSERKEVQRECTYMLSEKDESRRMRSQKGRETIFHKNTSFLSLHSFPFGTPLHILRNPVSQTSRNEQVSRRLFSRLRFFAEPLSRLHYQLSLQDTLPLCEHACICRSTCLCMIA